MSKSIEERIALGKNVDHTPITLNALNNTVKVDTKEFNRILCIELETASKENVLNAISEIEKNETVLYVGPDYEISISATPNDIYCTDSKMWAIEKIDLPSAWNITTGSSSVRVGVLDTGIDGSHPDLTNKINKALSCDFSTGNRVMTPNPTDIKGHGTHVAGIIGAQGNNSIGISGVCWNVELVSLKVISDTSESYSSYVLDAIDYASENNIQVLNASVSWGSIKGNMPSYDVSLFSAIQNYSGIFVCSSGNRGSDCDLNPLYPCNYNLPNLITVGSSNSNDIKNDSSGYGQTSVDIFAPGNSILSCYPTNLCNSSCSSAHESIGYHRASGTSMATPYVAGVAALLLSKYPNMTAAQIKATILANADSINSLRNLCTSGGRLNAYEALNNPITHNHSYSCQDHDDLIYHKYICNCGYILSYEKHTWVLNPVTPSSISPQYLPQYECTKCDAITLTVPSSSS